MMSGLLGMALMLAVLAESPVGWREDFNDPAVWHKMPPNRNWRYDGGKIAVPLTKFHVSEGALVIEAERSSGALMTMPRVDLRKYPILHWRWRVRNLPARADGRDPKLDDQAATLYVGTGGPLNRKALAFRWETVTPKGHQGTVRYLGGIVTVEHFCLRNQSSPINEWVEESVNVVELFQKVYGIVPGPDDYIVSFGANSQYTNSHTFAEFDFVELVKAEKPKKEEKK